MRVRFHVVGMLLLGLVYIAAFAAAVQWRVGEPLPARASASGASRELAPIEALASGLEDDLALAAGNLSQNRALGARALDAARRASRLGSEAVGEPFTTIHETVMRARIAVQNDAPQDARRLLDGRRVGAVGQQPEAPPSLEQYVGATLIDRRGVRIGEVAGVGSREGRPALRIALGRRNVLGFIDVDRRTSLVDPRGLVFGTPKAVGETLVALPR